MTGEHNPSQRLRTGLVLRPQGVRGELRVQPLADDVQRLLCLHEVWIAGSERTPPMPTDQLFQVHRTVARDGMAYMQLEGITDRDAAETLRNCYLYVDREQAAPLPENRWYVSDLVGCVVFAGPRELGTLVDIITGSHHDIYVIKGSTRLLVPALKQTVLRVDISEKRIDLDAQRLAETAVEDPL